MKVRVLVFATSLLLAAAPLGAQAQIARPTCTMSASSGTVQVGQTTNLSWQSFNATAGNITSIGSVPLAGTQGVIPTPPSTTYVGTFTGPGGSGVCSITITVNTGNGAGGYSDGTTPTTGTNPVVPGTTVGSPGRIVPCDGIDCQACSVAQLGQRIINWLIGFSIPLAAAMFAWAGILYFTSLSKPSQVEDAKRIFRNVGIGFVIVLCAWLGVQTLLKAVLKPAYYQSWNSIQCVQAGVNQPGGRQYGKSINDLLKSLPLLNKNVQYPDVSGTQLTCGGNLVLDNNACYTPEGTYVKTADVVNTTPGRYGVAGTLCANDNPACSPAALEAAGFTPNQAKAMSCIAVTESSGNPFLVNPQGGACGTFQILPSNWKKPNLHDGTDCTSASSCQNADCNLQAAATLAAYRQTAGQSPYADWTCPGCNSKAQACVSKYDPNEDGS